MLSFLTAASEIILKPESKSCLPHGMSVAEHVYLVEPPRPGTGFLRVCASPDGSGVHTTVRMSELNLRATMALA